MWIQFSSLLSKSRMLIANMPWPHWTVSTIQKTGGKRTWLLFSHKQLHTDHNNVLEHRTAIKPSPLLYCLALMRVRHADKNHTKQFLLKEYSVRTHRLLRTTKSGTDSSWDAEQTRLSLSSPEIIQQHWTLFARRRDHQHKLNSDTIKVSFKCCKKKQQMAKESNNTENRCLFKTMSSLLLCFT